MTVSHTTVDKATELRLRAFRLADQPTYPKMIPAPADRFWMDFSTKGWANRCLPLRIANQAGWFILNDATFEVAWDGNRGLEAIKFKGKERSRFVSSMFGYGVLTWYIPYLFRTPPGFDILARGPANSVKDAIAPLEGLVEADWLPYPFTMNWRFTRPFKVVKFEKDEPICMITPIRRGDLEAMRPEIMNIESDPGLNQSYEAWHQARKDIVERMRQRPADHKGFAPTQGHYIRGEGHLGEGPVAGHRNNLILKPFEELEPANRQSAEDNQVVAPASDESLVRRLLGRWLRSRRTEKSMR